MKRKLINLDRDNNIWHDYWAGLTIGELISKYKLSKARLYQIINKKNWTAHTKRCLRDRKREHTQKQLLEKSIEMVNALLDIGYTGKEIIEFVDFMNKNKKGQKIREELQC